MVKGCRGVRNHNFEKKSLTLFFFIPIQYPQHLGNYAENPKCESKFETPQSK